MLCSRQIQSWPWVSIRPLTTLPSTSYPHTTRPGALVRLQSTMDSPTLLTSGAWSRDLGPFFIAVFYLEQQWGQGLLLEEQTNSSLLCDGNTLTLSGSSPASWPKANECQCSPGCSPPMYALTGHHAQPGGLLQCPRTLSEGLLGSFPGPLSFLVNRAAELSAKIPEDRLPAS